MASNQWKRFQKVREENLETLEGYTVKALLKISSEYLLHCVFFYDKIFVDSYTYFEVIHHTELYVNVTFM